MHVAVAVGVLRMDSEKEKVDVKTQSFIHPSIHPSIHSMELLN
jgi:hypothetical protein